MKKINLKKIKKVFYRPPSEESILKKQIKTLKLKLEKSRLEQELKGLNTPEV
jgi:hypothetical protein